MLQLKAFWVLQGFSDSVDSALQLGNALMDKGVFSHVSNQHSFKNESNLYYRFKAHEEEYAIALSPQKQAHRLPLGSRA